MLFDEEYIYAGKILKTHGYQGYFLITVESFINGYLKKKEHIFIEIDGISVPFFIEDFEEKGVNTFILKLNDIETDFDAEEYIGCSLLLPSNKRKNTVNQFNILSLIDFKFRDINSNKEGVVIDVNEIPGNPLLRILLDDEREYYIPFHNKLVEKINIKQNILVMNLPEGLFESEK